MRAGVARRCARQRIRRHETRGLVDEGFLGRMRPGSLLVDVARGGVVDTAALTRAVADGRVRAALDVADPELLPPRHPLWSLPGALISLLVAGRPPEHVVVGPPR